MLVSWAESSLASMHTSAPRPDERDEQKGREQQIDNGVTRVLQNGETSGRTEAVLGQCMEMVMARWKVTEKKV